MVMKHFNVVKMEELLMSYLWHIKCSKGKESNSTIIMEFID